ncbi:MAG TPA: DUF308 domain-containing protein [Solirubrobacteraceae bacterium]|nr:DUF308 domain-containing protein [Solirubrobacteraceae bacterium]
MWGLLAVALGAVCIIWPGVTVGVVVALFAIVCFADAITQLVNLFRSDETAGRRVLMILMGLVDVAAGVIAIAYPGITASVLVIVVGIWAIVGGFMELGAAWQLPGSGSGWLAVGGVLSVIAGILLMAWPGIGAVTLALVFGIYLLAYGVTLLVAAARTPAGASVDALA